MATMNVALTHHWEGFIRQMIESGRYNKASEAVRADLRVLQEVEGESFPAGSLEHLHTKYENAGEARLARALPSVGWPWNADARSEVIEGFGPTTVQPGFAEGPGCLDPALRPGSDGH